MTYKITQLTKENFQSWDNYVQNHANGTIYHLSAWKALIEKEFRHDCCYLAALDQDEKIVGVLPLVNLRSRLFGNFMVSMPYFNYGGVLADNDDIRERLISNVIEISTKRKCSHIQLRDTSPALQESLHTSTHKVNMILALPDSVEALGKLIGSKKRSQTRRATREGVSFVIGSSELINDFYQVFSENMRDLGTPVYSKRFFEAICDSFAEHVKIAVVYWQGQPVATGFLMCNHHQMEIPWASTLRFTNKMSVNMYLYWNILVYAIEQGYKTFDFGRSSVDAGTYKFKKQWGAEPVQSYWYHWVPEGQPVPDLSPNNSKFELAIKVWQKLPLWLTKVIGPPVVKNLP